jgi:MraZ protein
LLDGWGEKWLKVGQVGEHSTKIENMATGYRGNFERSFDQKGRMTVPSDWRSEAHEKRLCIVPFKGHARVYPESWVDAQQQKLSGLKMNDPKLKAWGDLQSISQAAEADEQGRLMLRADLREKLNLMGELLLLGKGTHFEIWTLEEGRKQLPANTTFEDVAGVLDL